MRTPVTIGEQGFPASLSETAPASHLGVLLPVTVDRTDHAQAERSGSPASRRSPGGQPGAAEPGVGDLGCFGPGNDLVLHGGDQSCVPRTVVLAQVDDAAERVHELDGTVTATVRATP